MNFEIDGTRFLIFLGYFVMWNKSIFIIVGGSRNGQTSTALMVLLLSTALFLIPGLSPDQGEAKPEIDIQVHFLFSLLLNLDEFSN